MKAINRFWLYVYSTPNIAGCCLGLLGLGLYFTGVIDRFWFLIVAGLYLAGYIGWPRNEQLSFTMSSQLQAQQIGEELEKLLVRVHTRILPETFAKVQSIVELIKELLPKIDNDPQNHHLIVQTATDYLPSTLEHYLNLPPAFARFHPIKDGKSARQLLLEQLGLLETQLESVRMAIHRGDTEALLAQGRFLQDKFARDTTWDL